MPLIKVIIYPYYRLLVDTLLTSPLHEPSLHFVYTILSRAYHLGIISQSAPD
jgi:hypothetical protein